MMKPLPNGQGTQADAVAQFKRSRGKDHPKGVPPVEMPSSLGYLWEWFWELNTGRPVGGMGIPMPIPPTQILAWCQLRGVRLEDWELSTLQGLDATFLQISNRKDG